MIKNILMVEAAESKWLIAQQSSPHENMRKMEEMYGFCKKFYKDDLPPEKTEHVEMLIKLSRGFNRIRTTRACNA